MDLLKKDNYSNTLQFVGLFVCQQIIAFTWESFKLVSLYWLVIVFATLMVFSKLPYQSTKYKTPIVFACISIFGAFLSTFAGSSFAQFLVKSFYVFFGLVSYLYLDTHKVNTKIFTYLLCFLYLFFYLFYFKLDVGLRNSLDGNLFGHSSSNTIAISLNIVLLFYYIIEKANSGKTNLSLIILSVSNAILIGIQNSRAGMLVSASLVIFILFDYYGNKKKLRYLSIFIVIVLAAFLFNKYNQFLLDNTDLGKIQGVSDYEDNIRSYALSSFFEQLDSNRFLFGYPNDYEFVFGISRTFNAFVDFWSRYGFLPFLALILFIVNRIFRYKSFSIPLYVFIPILIYSFAESLWGGTLWDVLIYQFLFYNPTNKFLDKHE